MIRIEATARSGGMEVLAVGHAGLAPVGQDIVCAGVSALLFAFADHLERLSPVMGEMPSPVGGGEAPHLEYREGDGMLYLRTRALGGADTAAWAVVAAGLRRIAEAYPRQVGFKDGVTPPPASRQKQEDKECK